MSIWKMESGTRGIFGMFAPTFSHCKRTYKTSLKSNQRNFTSTFFHLIPSGNKEARRRLSFPFLNQHRYNSISLHRCGLSLSALTFLYVPFPFNWFSFLSFLRLLKKCDVLLPSSSIFVSCWISLLISCFIVYHNCAYCILFLFAVFSWSVICLFSKLCYMHYSGREFWESWRSSEVWRLFLGYGRVLWVSCFQVFPLCQWLLVSFVV